MSVRLLSSFIAGAGVGLLGGLIGLGGAEFRLPILISLFSFAPLPAVILNKAMSLVVVAFSLPFRMTAIPISDVFSHWAVIANLLGGSIVGAWCGASWAIRLKTQTFYRVICGLLLFMAVILLAGHTTGATGRTALDGVSLVIVGLGVGFAIGVVASLLGVAGGELLIPTLIILFGVDVRLAGSLSLAISLPTMLAGFARYSRDNSFEVLRKQGAFTLAMALGSIVGAYSGAQALKFVDGSAILPLLSGILVLSAWKMWKHSRVVR